MTQYMLSVHSTEEDHEMDFDDPEHAGAGSRPPAPSTTRSSSRASGCSAAASRRAVTATVVDAHGGETIADRRPLRSRPRSTSAASGSSRSPTSTPPSSWPSEASVACDGAVEVRRSRPSPRPEPPLACAIARDLERVFREEHGRVVATLIRLFGDIDVAEEAVQEAFLVAAQRWPETGRAAQPGGLDHHHRQNRALDRVRRESSRHDRQAESHAPRTSATSPRTPDP